MWSKNDNIDDEAGDARQNITEMRLYRNLNRAVRCSEFRAWCELGRRQGTMCFVRLCTMLLERKSPP